MEGIKHNYAGRKIRVGHGESSYLAFVPNPLPPRLAMDAEVVSSSRCGSCPGRTVAPNM